MKRTRLRVQIIHTPFQNGKRNVLPSHGFIKNGNGVTVSGVNGKIPGRACPKRAPNGPPYAPKRQKTARFQLGGFLEILYMSLILLAIEWCPGTESNHRHKDFQSSALPTELPGHFSVNGPSGKPPFCPEDHEEGLLALLQPNRMNLLPVHLRRVKTIFSTFFESGATEASFRGSCCCDTAPRVRL